jgi:hypothetical protein
MTRVRLGTVGCGYGPYGPLGPSGCLGHVRPLVKYLLPWTEVVLD